MRWIWVIFFLLFAGASASDTSARGGTFSFTVYDSPSRPWWDGGSAFMLLAGAGAWVTPALGGALTFSVNASPSTGDWAFGSAYIYQ